MALDVFDPALVPRPGSPKLRDYGNDKFEKIISFYGKPASVTLGKDSKGKDVSAVYLTNDAERRQESDAMIDAAKCKSEWESSRYMLALGKDEDNFDDVESFLQWYFGEGGRHAKYECMTPLLNIVTVLPVGSTTVERSFSRMKIIKTRLRNRMGDDTLESLMLIAMEGPDMLTDSLRNTIIDKFKKTKRRHVFL